MAAAAASTRDLLRHIREREAGAGAMAMADEVADEANPRDAAASALMRKLHAFLARRGGKATTQVRRAGDVDDGPALL